jgi:hypothetical protein
LDIPTLKALRDGEYIRYSKALSIYIVYLDLSPFFWYTDTKEKKMTALLVLFSFFIGFISCYFYMTKGIDQDGVWVSNKPSEDE